MHHSAYSNADCHLCCVSLGSIMLSGIRISVVIPSVFMLSVVMLSVVMLSVVVLGVVASNVLPNKRYQFCFFQCQIRVFVKLARFNCGKIGQALQS
jgi:hypothetical protein